MLGRKPNGRPDRPKVIGATRGEVRRRLAELKRKAEQGESTRDRSHARYSEVVHKRLIPVLGRHKLSALRPEAIATLYARKRAEGLAPGTVQKIHIVLPRALEMAVKWLPAP
jgi:hypothetical protein